MTPGQWVAHMRAKVRRLWPAMTPDERIKVASLMERMELHREQIDALGREGREAFERWNRHWRETHRDQ